MEHSSIFSQCSELSVPDTMYYASDISEITFTNEPEKTEE